MQAMKEAGAKIEAQKKEEEKKDNCIKEKMAKLARLNPFDGLVHNDDGTREFVEGGIVGGANVFNLRQVEQTANKQYSLAQGAAKSTKEEQAAAAEDESRNALVLAAKEAGKKSEEAK